MRSAETARQKWAADHFDHALSQLDTINPPDRAKLETPAGMALQVIIGGLVLCVLAGQETEATLTEVLRNSAKTSEISEEALRAIAEFVRGYFIAGNHATGGAPFQGELPK